MVAKHYAAIFTAPGSKGFSAAAFVGRLPISMLGLGIILMIKESTGKYALAGVVSGTMALVEAFFGPFLARLIDRRGQAEIGFPSLAVSTAALISLMLCVRFDEPTWTWFASAALAGAFLPNVGALVRARWTKLYTGTPALHTAYSFEAVMDEVKRHVDRRDAHGHEPLITDVARRMENQAASGKLRVKLLDPGLEDRGGGLRRRVRW